MYYLGMDALSPADLLGADQVTRFVEIYCRPAQDAEVQAAGFDASDVEAGDPFLYLVHSPRRVVRIPGFSRCYQILLNWSAGQIIHPLWLR